jgi:glucosamine--fructose-6-phosphate aminotransferase (isomerizing)
MKLEGIVMKRHTLENEIHQQPDVVERLIHLETNRVKKFTNSIHKSFDQVLIAARGTSDNAARYAQYLFGAQNRLPVTLATPSLFTLYHRSPALKRMLIIAISQSGRSPDIISVVEEGNRQNQITLAITNDIASPLAKVSSHVIALHAGAEKSTAATKTYTSSLAALALLSCHISGDRERLIELEHTPAIMRKTLETTSNRIALMERYRYMDRITVISRGYNYATSYEVAIKIRELSGVLAESYSSADFMHGPIAVIKTGYPVMVIATHGNTASDLNILTRELLSRGAEIIAISNIDSILHKAQLALHVPRDIPEWLSPMVMVLPGQIFALRLTEEKNLNPDLPNGISKITKTY